MKVTFLLSLGGGGVDLFFLISGFIMYVIHFEDFGKSKTIEFIKKRLIRIVPLYWFYTTIFLLLVLFLPNVFANYKMGSFSWVLSSYLFLPDIGYNGNIFPILNIGWTLNYEMFFYFIFSIFLIFKRKYLLLLPLLFMFLLILEFNNFYITYYSNNIILEFLLGIFIGYLYKRYNKLYINQFYLITLFVFGVVLSIIIYILDYDLDRIIVYGIGFSLVLYSFVFLEKIINFSNKYLILLGNISYSLYLSHIFSISLVGKLISNVPLLILFSLITSLFVAYLSYVIIEKPIHKYLRNKI